MDTKSYFGALPITARYLGDTPIIARYLGDTKIYPISSSLLKNGKYWSYNGNTIVLKGGSSDNNMFNNDLPTMYAELDTLASNGGNFIRMTLSGVSIKPFLLDTTDTTRYNLNTFNENFFNTVGDFVNECKNRGIIVQIDLWEKFLYFNPGGAWDIEPFNPDNNVNYNEAGGASPASTLTVYQDRDTSPSIEVKFMATVPNLNNDTVVLPYQEAYISKMMDTLLPYDNVLYNIGNEDSTNLEWNYYWNTFIKNKATQAGKQINTSSMRDTWDYTDTQVTTANDTASGVYDFFEASQFTHSNDDTLWNELKKVRDNIGQKPINIEKIYGGTANSYGTVADGIKRFFVSYVFGVSAMRFHRPTEGVGNTAIGYQTIRLLDDIETITSATTKTHDLTHSKIVNRVASDSYLMYETGAAYVAYTGSGSITIDTTGESGTWAARWANIDNGSIFVVSNETAGSNLVLTAPESSGYGWVVILTNGAETVDYIPATNYIVHDDVMNMTNGWSYRYGTYVYENNKFRIDTTSGYGGILNTTLAVPAVADMRLSFSVDDIGGTNGTPFVVIKDASGADIVSQPAGYGANSITFTKPTNDTQIRVYLLLQNTASAYYYNLKLEEA